MSKRDILLAAALLSGCIKSPKKDLIYGPEVSPQKLASELEQAVGLNDSPGLIRKDEFVGRETTRVIRGRPVLDILNSTEVTVVDRIETATQWQIKDVERIQNYNPGDPTQTPPPIVREDHKCWNKESLERVECDIVPASHRFFSSAGSLDEMLKPFSHFQQNAAPEDKTVTYHNLEVTKMKAAPPGAVAQDSNCQGIPNCQIDITHIEFDRVNWTENPEGYKIHYSIKVSQDVPQLSRFLESCQQGSIQVLQPGQSPESAPRYLVTFCEAVKNFIRGH